MPWRDSEVQDFVLSWLGAKQAADADGIRRSLSTYAETLAIGTDVSEWFAGRDAFVLPVRLTLVLVRDGDDWHIVQTHASAPSNG